MDKFGAITQWVNNPKRVYKIIGFLALLMFLCLATMTLMQTAAGQTVYGYAVSGAVTPPGFQLDAGVKAQGISASMSEAGWPAAMASSVALR